ncbi:MAG: hypothetical protein HY720_23225 [Planctomycetes bacterium]|nr:hypothetical protein [Planctomycetota bacterium]
MFIQLSRGIESLPGTLGSQRIVRERLDRTLGHLSSGLRIRKASDDPGGLVVSDVLRAKVRSLEQANENIQNGTNLIATAEGALGEVSDLLVKLRELTVQSQRYPDAAANEALQKEADQILDSIARIGDTTRAGRVPLLTGDFQRTATVSIASSAGVGAVGVRVPAFSTISLGFHELVSFRGGAAVVGVDTSAATVGLGEEGQVTDGGGTTVAMTNNNFVFQAGGNWWVQDATGFDPPTNLTAGFANVADVRIGPDQNSIIFEADNGPNRGIFQVTFAGVPTQLAEGVNDFDYDITPASLFPGTQELVYVSPSLFPVNPSINDVDEMAYSTLTGTLFAADNNAAGGLPGIQEFNVDGTPVGGIVSLAPVFVGPGATVDGLTYFGGTTFFGLDATNGVIHRFTIAGGVATPVATFAAPTASVVASGTLTLGVGGSVNEAVGPAVTAPASVQVRETLTLTFTEDAGGGIQYQVSGSESGSFGPLAPFASGVPITVDGITFTLGGGLDGASRGAFGMAAATVTDGLNDSMVVNIDGLGPVAIDLITLGDPEFPGGTLGPGGAAIAARIDAKILAATGVATTTTFDASGGGRLIVTSPTPGGSVVITPAGVNDVSATLLLGVPNGGFEGAGANVLTGDTYVFNVTGAGAAPTGLAYDGANLRLGDAATGFIYRVTTAGVQLNGGIDYGSLGPGAILRLEHDPSTPTGSLFVVNTAGTIREIDDTPAPPGPNNITAVPLGIFAQPGTIRGIARFPTFNNLFLGDDAGQQVFQFTNGGVDTANNVFRQNLVSGAINQVSGEGGSEIDPQISDNATRIAYLTAAGDLITRNLTGGAVLQALGVGAISIDDLSPDGRFVGFQTGAGGRVKDMTVPLGPVVTGANHQFDSTSTFVFFFNTGLGQIQRRNLLTGATITLSGGAIPPGSADFDLSPSNARLAFSSGGQIYTINSDGSSPAATDITQTPPASPNPGGGTSPSFSPDSSRVLFQGADGDVWVRNQNGTNISVLPPGGAFSAAPAVTPVNTLVQETFTLTVITDNDGADVFSVTGSVSGAHANATSGIAYISDPGGGGLGQGLSFTIAQGGQYAVGTTFTIDTDFTFGTSLDRGPIFVAPAGTTETAYTPDGSSLEIDFGTIVPPVTVVQSILVSPGGAIQSGSETTGDDQVPYHIDMVSPSALDLVPFDLSEFPTAIRGTTLSGGGLVLTGYPTIVDPDERMPAESILVEFITPLLFNVTGSVSGPIAENVAFVSGVPNTVANIQFTLTGVAALGDELTIEVGSTAAAVDQAIDKIARLRSILGAKTNEAASIGLANAAEILNLVNTVSSIRDADFGAEAADLVRNQVLSAAATGIEAQANATRETILSLLQDNMRSAARS